MIEILPNWHPIFVHMTVTLVSISVIFYFLSYFTQFKNKFSSGIVLEFEVVARWCLWLAGIITIFTVIAGFHAYYTVKHDAISHVIMTTHRNWALSTATIILITAIWSVWRYFHKKVLSLSFIIILPFMQILLLITAWYGAELVFRYGIGVLSLPKAEETGHIHQEIIDEKPHVHME